MNEYAQNCISSVAASLSTIMGIEPPKDAGAANPAFVNMAERAFAGRKADRVLMYNPDAIAHYIFARYTDLFQPVLSNTSLALPMQSVMPSVTPVCFASMYSGAMPDIHGIKAYVKPVLTVETIFDACIRSGKKPAIVSTKGDSISMIFLERDMDYFLFDNSDEVNIKAKELIQEDKYDIIVVYNGNFDSTMHRCGPEAPESLEALKKNARVFDELCTLVKENWKEHDTVVAFAPDHGCHLIDGGAGSHGLDQVEDMLIPHFYGAFPKA